MKGKSLIIIFCLIVFSLIVNAQSASENGYHIAPYGKLHILLVFAEVSFDNPENDPYPNGSKTWKKNQLPTWKDDVFDPKELVNKRSKMTRYFDYMSMGNFQVYGDYLDELIVVSEKDLGNMNSRSSTQKAVLNALSKKLDFKTAYLVDKSEFDQWNYSAQAGKPKSNVSNNKFDHIMIIIRNAPSFGNGAGYVMKSNVVNWQDWGTDTFSMFGGGSNHPFNILRHEFSHLLFGGNNFHCAGGQHRSGGANYFIPFQGGWSMLGGYGSTFMTCNAWDRHRLGWKGKGHDYLISAENAGGEEVDADIVLENKQDTVRLVLDDFITSGDAVRIKLPFIGEEEFSQYIWLENHQTFARNGCEFDRFMYEEEYSCRSGAVGGLYAYVQVDKDEKDGPFAFKGYGDYLRFLPADGFYDVTFGDTLVKNNCVNNGKYYPYSKRSINQNPLSGNSDLEEVAYDENGNGKIGKTEGRKLTIEKRNGMYYYELAKLGHQRHAFRLDENHEISMSSNPSSSSMQTLVSNETAKFEKRNNRTIYLNGLTIRILKEWEGKIMIEIITNNVRMDQDVVWRGDNIVLPKIKGEDGYSMILEKRKKVILKRSVTPSRLNEPEVFKNDTVFTSKTKFSLEDDVIIRLEKKSKIIVTDDSEFVIGKAKIEFGRKAKIIVYPGAKLTIDPSNQQNFKIKYKKKGLE